MAILCGAAKNSLRGTTVHCEKILYAHVQNQCFTKFNIIGRKMPSFNGLANYQAYLTYICRAN
jgi:hypothetical protein